MWSLGPAGLDNVTRNSRGDSRFGSARRRGVALDPRAEANMEVANLFSDRDSSACEAEPKLEAANSDDEDLFADCDSSLCDSTGAEPQAVPGNEPLLL